LTLRDRILSVFSDSAFRAPVLKLLSGTGVAFIVAYLANIVLLRLYPDEFWGVADYIIAWVSILAPVASLRYEDALMLPKDRRQAAHAFILAIAAVLVSATLLFTFLALSDSALAFFEEKKAGRWMLLVPLALMANRFAKISELWLSRQESFGNISAAQVVQSTSMVSVRIGTGLSTPGPGGLIWGFIAGFGLSTLGMSRRVVLTLRASLEHRPTLREFREVASRYRRFPQFTMPAALISGLITRLPILLIPEFFDMGVAGQYSRGFSILFVPLSLLAAAVAQVFFVRAVEANRSGTLGAFAGNVHARLVLMCFWPTVILMTAGADIFQVLFGEAWRDSASYLGFVAPWILFSVVASPLTRLFDVLERQRLELLATVLMLAVISATLFYGGQTGDIKVTLLALGIGGTVIRLGQIMLLLHLAGTSLTAMIRPYLSYIVWSLPLLGGIFWITTLGMPILTTIAGTIGGLIFYAFIAFREKLI